MRHRKYSLFITSVLEYLMDLGGEVCEYKDRGYIKVWWRSPWLGVIWFTIPHYHRYSYSVFIKFRNKTSPPRNLKPYNRKEQEYNFHSVKRAGQNAFNDFKKHIQILIEKP